MSGFARPTRLMMCLVGLQVLLATEAYAYLDPGTGSFVFQIIVATFVGAAVTVKMYWHQLKGFLLRRGRPADEDKSEPSEPS